MRNRISILSAGVLFTVITAAGVAALFSAPPVTAARLLLEARFNFTKEQYKAIWRADDHSKKERSQSPHWGSAEYSDKDSSAASDDNKSTLSGSTAPTPPPPPSTTPFNDSSAASDDNKSTLSGSNSAPPPPSTTSFNDSSALNTTTPAGSNLAPPTSSSRRSHHRKRKRGSKSKRGSLTGGQNGAASDTTADVHDYGIVET